MEADQHTTILEIIAFIIYTQLVKHTVESEMNLWCAFNQLKK